MEVIEENSLIIKATCPLTGTEFSIDADQSEYIETQEQDGIVILGFHIICPECKKEHLIGITL